MLSKIIRGKNTAKLVTEKYSPPSSQEVGLLIEEKKRELQRLKIIDDHIDDPVKAAKSEAQKILIEAQEKLKAAEAEATLIKIRKEKELRLHLEKESQLKVEQLLRRLKENYHHSLEELAALKQNLCHQLENQLMDLVFSISRKVIDSEIKTSPTLVLGMLKKGFEKINEARECEIKINPDDYDTIINKSEEIKQIIKSSASIKFVKDENIERGGCRIITERGVISSEPGKQLEIIESELSDEHRA